MNTPRQRNWFPNNDTSLPFSGDKKRVDNPAFTRNRSEATSNSAFGRKVSTPYIREPVVEPRPIETHLDSEEAFPSLSSKSPIAPVLKGWASIAQNPPAPTVLPPVMKVKKTKKTQVVPQDSDNEEEQKEPVQEEFNAHLYSGKGSW